MSPFPPASATGVGSLPGTHSHEWSRVIVGELPELVHVPELPARGPGSDVVGRTMALLGEVAPDLAVETTPSGWRFADAPGRIMTRARSWLNEDCDGLQEALNGRSTTIKQQLCGPWTLAAAVEMRNGERAVRDHGACRDIAGALAEVVASQLRDLRRRCPDSSLVLQLDEPSLPSVLAGGVTTASGLATYRSVDVQRAQQLLALPLAAAMDGEAMAGVHCCHPKAPVDLMVKAGARMLSIDLRHLDTSREESLAQSLEDGIILMLGVTPTEPQPVTGPTSQVLAGQAARRVLDWFSRWGFTPEQANPRVVLTPECGLAGSNPTWVRDSYSALREAGRLVRDDVEVSEDEG